MNKQIVTCFTCICFGVTFFRYDIELYTNNKLLRSQILAKAGNNAKESRATSKRGMSCPRTANRLNTAVEKKRCKTHHKQHVLLI